MLLDFWPLLALQFSAAGWLDRATAVKSGLSLGWSPLFFLPPGGADAFYCVAFAGLLGFLLGYKTRLSGCVAVFCLLAFRDRNFFPFDGDDEYVRMLLLLLVFAPCGAAWSLDSRKSGAREGPGWVLRLIQIQLTLVYLSNGVAKLHGPTWWDGTAIQLAVNSPAYGRFALDGTGLIGTALRWATWGTPIFEILLPLAFWIPQLRGAAILSGILFHLGTSVLIKLRFFPLIMISWYLAFYSFNRGRSRGEKTRGEHPALPSRK